MVTKYEELMAWMYDNQDELEEEGLLESGDMNDAEFFHLAAQHHNLTLGPLEQGFGLPERSALFHDVPDNVSVVVSHHEEPPTSSQPPNKSAFGIKQPSFKRKSKAKAKATAKATAKPDAKPKPKAKRKPPPSSSNIESFFEKLPSCSPSPIAYAITEYIKYDGDAEDTSVDVKTKLSAFRAKNRKPMTSGQGVPWKILRRDFSDDMSAQVYIDNSSIGPAAGLGLFAHTDIKQGTLITFIRQWGLRDMDSKSVDYFDPKNNGPAVEGIMFINIIFIDIYIAL